MSANAPAATLAPVPLTAPTPDSIQSWIALAASTINQMLDGTAVLVLRSRPTPPTPPSGQFFLYVDAADNKIKVIGSNGTITTIANP